MEEPMIKNLEKETGKSFSELLEMARKSGFQKHGQLVKHLKESLGIGHGYANLIALKALKLDAGSVEGDLVAQQYRSKENLRPIYDALVKSIKALGDDVEVAPKKQSVSLRRKRQFALIQPSTKTRIDLGLKFNNRPVGGRLESSGPFGTMCTHRVQLTKPEDVDGELLLWLREAYEEAG